MVKKLVMNEKWIMTTMENDRNKMHVNGVVVKTDIGDKKSMKMTWNVCK